MFAAYIPNWTRAVDNIPIQLVTIGAVAVAIFVFARQRHTHLAIMFTLVLGIGLGTLLWLQTAKWFDPYWFGVASFFELYRFQIAGGIGAIFGWVSLEMVAYFRKRMRNAKAIE